MLAVGVGSRCVDKHADMTSRVHDVLADGLLLLKSGDDVVQSPGAIDVLVNVVTFALVGDIVIVYPTSKSLFDLRK
jgi:hypothetical protein